MQADQIQSTAGVDPATLGAIERVYRAWDAALSSKDVEAAVVLYADDIRLESPLVRHLTGWYHRRTRATARVYPSGVRSHTRQSRSLP
jgi:hypothetical protein